jgi:integrase
MARNPRERFERERDRIADLEDPEVRAALTEFADAVDPEFSHTEVPEPAQNGGVRRDSKSNNTAKNYLSGLRCAHQRGLDLLEVEASTVNDFMRDLVTEPERRRYDLVEYQGSIGKPSAKSWQSALRAFYRFCTEPGVADERPEVAVGWPASDIIMFTERSDPKHDEDDMPEQADLDAMREACLQGQNTRRDQAFLEIAAGTGQRIRALVTLRVGDVRLDDEVPHVLLNPEIAGDGDKGAIENTGRMKPIVTGTGPVRQWIENHPLQDPEVREEHGAPTEFEDCYLFVGSLRQSNTDASSNWGAGAARNMLERRKEDTETMHGVKTVDIPVNPHNWRHYAYTQSQDLPMDESTRRAVFGWAKGSDTGQQIYGHKENEKAVREFAEKWAETHGEVDTEGVAEQVVGQAVAGDLSPEALQGVVEGLIGNEAALDELAEAVMAAAE